MINKLLILGLIFILFVVSVQNVSINVLYWAVNVLFLNVKEQHKILEACEAGNLEEYREAARKELWGKMK